MTRFLFRLRIWAVKLPLAILAFIMAGALAGAVFQLLAQRADTKKFSPPGMMVSVGDHHLHIVCMGTGGPAVILDAALGASHLSWSLVQPEVAKFAQVCAYDRAGCGWSEPGPCPRTIGRAVEELHMLLKNAELNPPFVLVGHSIGGLNVRLFAFRYPDEVAGLILVDPAHEDQDERLPPSARDDPASPSKLSVIRLTARLGWLRLLNMPLGVGNVPLMVLTRSEKEEGSPDAEETLMIWSQLHRELVRESDRGEWEAVPHSGHSLWPLSMRSL
jgi:pimeloyl-ACP methyl ester carboxylesterase